MELSSSLASERLYAEDLDRKDDLASFRERFSLIPGAVYMDGNSLGLCPRDAEKAIAGTVEEWKGLGIRGWMEGNPPWFEMAERVGGDAAPLVGADPDEVVLAGTTTVNLHALVSTFYEPTPERSVILADELNFPSDLYALGSQVALRGFDPDKSLRLAGSPDERTLDEEKVIGEMKPDVCLVVLPSVLYRSGQLLDMERLAMAAHDRGIPIGFDCAHSAGAI
ncbi:MAG TPA: kynureninase, partial [Synergistales bacterium]|nr:kynureninase [Synergistales bacterium]